MPWEPLCCMFSAYNIPWLFSSCPYMLHESSKCNKKLYIFLSWHTWINTWAPWLDHGWLRSMLCISHLVVIIPIHKEDAFLFMTVQFHVIDREIHDNFTLIISEIYEIRGMKTTFFINRRRSNTMGLFCIPITELKGGRLFHKLYLFPQTCQMVVYCIIFYFILVFVYLR